MSAAEASRCGSEKKSDYMPDMLTWDMGKEQPQPSEPFSFNEREKLFNRISDNRFQMLLADGQTTIHDIQQDTNSFGEFVFVTVSRPGNREKELEFLTFYGYGFHEYRERWLTQEWAWYQAHPCPETKEKQMSQEEAVELLQSRREEIAPYVKENTQTGRGRLYEIIADLTDEDGALAELDDLGYLWDQISDTLE
jgi:hypothetical protein